LQYTAANSNMLLLKYYSCDHGSNIIRVVLYFMMLYNCIVSFQP